MAGRHEPPPDEPRFAHVAERLVALREADARVAHAVDGVVEALSTLPETAIDTTPAGALHRATGTLRASVPAALSALALEGQDVPRPAEETPSTASQRLQSVYSQVGRAHGTAVALFQTSRLMLVGTACDFALERIETYRSLASALDGLLPQVVAWELREEGLACHCVCPMCGLGLCGCIWASLHNVDLALGGTGVAPDERGIPLRSPPRPGSQLAAAEVRQWDRVVSVDGEPVRTVPELQQALRRHAIGDNVRLGITRNGGRQDLTVQHLSDFQ